MASAIWKGHLSFGLVSIPVRLVRAARPERVSLHQLYRAAGAPGTRPRGDVIELPVPQGRETGATEMEPPPRVPPREIGGAEFARAQAAELHGEPPVERVRQGAFTGAGERPISAADLVKGYEYQPDRWVLIDRDEIKRITPKTSKVMEIVEFVRFAEVDPVYLESSYYVVPERTGEKAYAILYQALRETNYAAVAEMAMHGREHIVIVRPGRTGLIAHTMFFENEVRKDEEHRTDASLATKRELDLAKMLVESLAQPFEPGKYHDTYRAKLDAIIAAKVQGPGVVETQAPAPARAPVLDMVEALQRSLEAVRKPPAAAPSSAGKPKKRAGRRTGKA